MTNIPTLHNFTVTCDFIYFFKVFNAGAMLTTLRQYFSPFARRNEELRLLEIFRPLYVVLSLLGLIPCSIEFPKGKQDCVILHRSAFNHSLCALFTLLTVYVFFAIHVHQVLTSRDDNILVDDKMAKTNYIIELVTQLIFCNAAYFCAFRRKYLYVTMLKEITRSWDDLPYVNRGAILGYLRVKINCVIFGSLIVLFTTLMAVTYTGSSSLWKRILITLSFNLPEMIQFIVVSFYYVLVLTVVALLKNIETHCKMLLRARRSIKNNSSKVEPGRIPISLSQMQSVYVKALRIKRQINSVFQAPILFSLLQCFHTMVSESYDICQGLLYQDKLSTHSLVECSYWVTLQLLKVYALAHSGTLLKSQALRIGQTIHNIPTNGDDDIKLFVEIQHFSTLMSFQDPEITIFGYFPLEAPLMFNMIAAAAMYLIILVQFAKAK
uniref:Gustatory receptor n=1 Tax=Lobesia botrana TaxID=209534 RepID=A0A345BF07_9NEOP|nr:gustatory receptor GR68.2 [Lobesia botrana]